MGTKVRLSNFELLRILCMFGVLTTHSLQHLYDLQTTNFSFLNEMRVFIMNAGCLAVNCFVLISGYFQIHQSWKGFVKLVAPCFCWALICNTLSYCYDGMSLLEACKHIFFPLTGGNEMLWFMVAYFALYLIAPILNSAINSMDDTRLGWSVIMLLIVDVYIGYMHQSKEVTLDGYHLVHFMTLYVIASFIYRKCLIISNIKWGGWVICGLLVFMTLLHMCKMVFFPISVIYSMRYNSPMIMLTSVLTFIWFSHFKFRSASINRVSACVLAVYLISSQPIAGNRLYNWLISIKDENEGIIAFVLIFGAMLAFYFVCVVLEMIRQWNFRNLELRLSDCLNKIFTSIRFYL